MRCFTAIARKAGVGLGLSRLDPFPLRAVGTDRFWGKWAAHPHHDTHLDLGHDQHPNSRTLWSTVDAFFYWGPSNTPGPVGGTGPSPGPPRIP